MTTRGLVFDIVAILLALFVWQVSPDKTISLRWILPIWIACAAVIATLANAAYESFQMSRGVLPRMLVARKPPTETEGATVLCLLEPSELFSHDTVVAFYYIGHENFEQLIGIGRVLNIQDDGKIQVTLNYTLDGHEETVNKLAQNDSEVLNKTRVKPNVPKRFVLFAGG